jgi:hypothetical protein
MKGRVMIKFKAGDDLAHCTVVIRFGALSCNKPDHFLSVLSRASRMLLFFESFVDIFVFRILKRDCSPLIFDSMELHLS